MRCTLCCIHQNNTTICMNLLNDCLYRIDTAQYIRYMSNCCQFGMRCDFILDFLCCQCSTLFAIQIYQSGSGGFCHHLPWKQVTVMLHNCNQYLILCMQKVQSIAVRHQINTFCCISGKDDLLCASCIEEASDTLPCIFILFCRLYT